MKNNLSKFLASFVICSTLMADTGTNTNLSQVKFRDYYDAPYAMTGCAKGMAMENMEREDAFGGCFSVMGFWEQSVNGTRGSQELAKGFGINKLNSFAIKNNGTTGTPTANNTNSVDLEFLLHGASAGETTLSLEAKHRRYGANFGYCQDLSNFYEGLKFRVSGAVLGVRNELVSNFSETTAVNRARNLNPAAGVAPTINTTVTVKDFFTADSAANAPQGTGTVDTNSQKLLTRAIFKGSHQTEYHFNDIRACLGLNIVDSENAKVCVGLEGVIPVGRELDGKYVMEPQVGNRHFKLGAAIDAYACLSEGADYQANLNLSGLWHYGFKREGVRLPSHTKYNYGHYHLGYKKGTTTKSLEPIVNLISNKVDIKPANMFNGTAMLCLSKGCLCFDLGYNFYYSQDERNDVKGWTDNEIYVAHSLFNTNVNTFDGGTDSTALKKTDLTWDAKSQTHHHVFGSLGFMCKDWQYPASINLAGGYEFANNRTRTREVWSIALKGGLCF